MPAESEVCVPGVGEGRVPNGGNPAPYAQSKHSVFLTEPDLWLVPFCLDIDFSSTDGDPVSIELLPGWPGMG